MNETMNQQGQQMEQQRGIPAGSGTPSGRRRFVRGIGVAIPVVLTVSSRSTLAATCLSPSANASISLLHSRPDRPGGICSGQSPGYWKNAAQNHGDLTARSELFANVFFGGSSVFSGKTMEDVTAMGGNANNKALARHLAAAWCNLQKGWTPSTVLSLAGLQAMWNGRDGSGGSYSPTAGVTWNDAQMVDYIFANTMT